jgi:hypothetical protein
MQGALIAKTAVPIGESKYLRDAHEMTGYFNSKMVDRVPFISFSGRQPKFEVSIYILRREHRYSYRPPHPLLRWLFLCLKTKRGFVFLLNISYRYGEWSKVKYFPKGHNNEKDVMSILQKQQCLEIIAGVNTKG